MEFYNCDITEQGIQNVNEVLKSKYLNQGPWVKRLEDTFKNDWNIKNPLTLNSCTSALHIALELSNVKGKEVILPAKTFVATGMAVLMAGGKPIFCDIDPVQACPSVHNIESLISPQTAAVIGVSWGGHPDVAYRLRKIKRYYPELKVIEDAAHSFGSQCNARESVDFVCYSFQAIKVLTCADGGLLSCRSDEDYEKAKAMRWFGINKDKMTFSDIGERQFSIDTIGYKYNMNDLNAALLMGNLEGFEERKKRRMHIYERYLNETDWQVKICFHDVDSSYWLCPVLVERRDDFIKVLRSKGVPATKTDSRIDTNPIFGNTSTLPGTHCFDTHEANLPIHSSMTEEDVDLVIQSINGGW